LFQILLNNVLSIYNNLQPSIRLIFPPTLPGMNYIQSTKGVDIRLSVLWELSIIWSIE